MTEQELQASHLMRLQAEATSTDTAAVLLHPADALHAPALLVRRR